MFKRNEPCFNHHSHGCKHEKMAYSQQKSVLYFGCGCIVNVLCIFLIFGLTKYEIPFIEYYLKPYCSKSENCSDSQLIISLSNRYIFVVFRKMYKFCLALFCVTFVTFLVWPSMLVHTESRSNETINEHHSMPIILTFVFVFGDFVGRQWLTKVVRFYSYKHLWKVCIVRIALFPFAYDLWLRKHWIWKDSVLYFIVALLSISDGYFRCLCFIHLPKRLNPDQQQTGAALLSFALICGMTVGCACQLLVVS